MPTLPVSPLPLGNERRPLPRLFFRGDRYDERFAAPETTWLRHTTMQLQLSLDVTRAWRVVCERGGWEGGEKQKSGSQTGNHARMCRSVAEYAGSMTAQIVRRPKHIYARMIILTSSQGKSASNRCCRNKCECVDADKNGASSSNRMAHRLGRQRGQHDEGNTRWNILRPNAAQGSTAIGAP